MTLTDPRPFLDKIDPGAYATLLKKRRAASKLLVEPKPQQNGTTLQFLEPHIAYTAHDLSAKKLSAFEPSSELPPATAAIRSKAYVLGDFIDTDAVSAFRR